MTSSVVLQLEIWLQLAIIKFYVFYNNQLALVHSSECIVKDNQLYALEL